MKNNLKTKKSKTISQKKGAKKGFFKRFLEKLAKSAEQMQQSNGCST